MNDIGPDCVDLVISYLQERELTRFIRTHLTFELHWTKKSGICYRKQIRLMSTNGLVDIAFDHWHTGIEDVYLSEFTFDTISATRVGWSDLDDSFFNFFGMCPPVPDKRADLGIHGYVLLNSTDIHMICSHK